MSLTPKERKRMCDEVCEEVAKETDTVLLSFSCGKDSISTWLQIQPFFKRVIPYYLYTVPHLGFVDRALAYYEDFFQTRIYRYPHPSGLKMLRHGMFGAPFESEYWIFESQIGYTMYDYRQLEDVIRACEGVPQEAYAAIGVRAGDSITRRVNIKQNGAVRPGLKTFYPIAYYEPDDLCDMLEASGIKLPPDYHMFQRSFDGFAEMYTRPIRDYYPEDFEKIKKYFPLVDADIFRREVRKRRTGKWE